MRSEPPALPPFDDDDEPPRGKQIVTNTELKAWMVFVVLLMLAGTWWLVAAATPAHGPPGPVDASNLGECRDTGVSPSLENSWGVEKAQRFDSVTLR